MSALASRTQKHYWKPSNGQQKESGNSDDNKSSFEQLYRIFKDQLKNKKPASSITSASSTSTNWNEVLPAKPCFKAKFLGLNFSGRFVIHIDDTEFVDLRKSLAEFYESDKTREQYRIPQAELRVGLFISYVSSGEYGRAKLRYVDPIFKFCSVEDIDTAEFHAVGFEFVLWLDESYQKIPPKAFECELHGLEEVPQNVILDAFMKVKLKDQRVRVTVRNTTGSKGYPVVSIVTREDKQDLFKLLGPKLGVKIDPNGDMKIDTKGDMKIDVKIDTKIDMKIDTKSDMKIDTKSDMKIDTKSDRRTDTKSDSKIDPAVESTKSTTNESQVAKWYKPKDEDIAEAYEAARTDLRMFFEQTDTKEGVPLKKLYGRVTSTTGRPILWQKMGFSHWLCFLFHCDHLFYLKASKADRSGSYLVFSKNVPEEPNFPLGFHLVQSDILLTLVPNEILQDVATLAKFPPEGPSVTQLPPETSTKLSTGPGESLLLHPSNTSRRELFSVKELSESSTDLYGVGIGEDIKFTLTKEETPFVFWSHPEDGACLPPPPSWKAKPWKLGKEDTMKKWEREGERRKNSSTSDRLRYAGVPPVERFQFPQTSPFKATLLGADSYGFMHIEVEDFMLKVHYNELEASLKKFYSEDKTREAYKFTLAEMQALNCSHLVAVYREGNFIRGRIFEMDMERLVCIVFGAEDPEFFFAPFGDVYRLDPKFEYLPPKAKMCILAGLEQHILTDHIADAIEKTPLSPSLVLVTVLDPKDDNFGLPRVSMNWNGQDFYAVLKERAGNLLKAIIVKEMEARVAQQMKILQHLKDRKYLM